MLFIQVGFDLVFLATILFLTVNIATVKPAAVLNLEDAIFLTSQKSYTYLYTILHIHMSF